MEIKEANKLGVSMQGRVGERSTARAFSIADKTPYTAKQQLASRTLKLLVDKGLQLTDEAIDAKLDEEMIRGSTLALAGEAEDQLETDILTKNFTVAGHRNMSAKIKHTEWQASQLQELVSGVHNDKSPLEYGAFLTEKMNLQLMEDVKGMSREARAQVLESILTGNQSLIAQQAKLRTESIIDATMGNYSMRANTLLAEGNLNKNTTLEGATVQQFQALAREIYNDTNLPSEVKMKLLQQMQKGSADAGFINGAKALLDTPVELDGQGGFVTLGQRMSTEDFIKGTLAINKAEKDNKWAYSMEGRTEFLDFEKQIKQGSFEGEERDVLGAIRKGLSSNTISEAEATSLYRHYLDNQYLQDINELASRYWEENNLKGLQSLKLTRAEGMKAFTDRMERMGYSLPQKIDTATNAFTANNGNIDIVQWVGSEILQPILGEVINSEGDVLTENVEVFHQVMQQVDKFEGQSRQLYIAGLLLSLDSDESDFVLQYIGNAKSSDENTAREVSRRTYLDNQTRSESERSTAVRGNRKLIDNVVNKFDKQSAFGNFLGINKIKATLGSEKGAVDLKTGTPSPTWWTTAHDNVVADRVKANMDSAKEIAEAYVRANPLTATEENVTTHVLAELSSRVMGEGDNVIVSREKGGLQAMFPDLPQELMAQQDDIVNYMLSKANLEEELDITGFNDMQKSFVFDGDVLHVSGYGRNGSSIRKTVRPETLRPLVDEYRDSRFDRSSSEETSRYAQQMLQKADFNHIGFDASFRVYDYGNKLVKNYSPLLIEKLYEDNLPLEGWELSLYADDPRGGSRQSIGMGVNSGNKFNADGSRNKYTPYFEIAEKRPLTKEEAEDLTQIAVEDHLTNASAMINNRLGKEYLTESDDLTLAMFKLSYAQWKGDPESTNKILDGVAEGDYDKMLEGLHTSRFFRDTAGGQASGAQYEYVLRKLIGAMQDVQSRKPR